MNFNWFKDIKSHFVYTPDASSKFTEYTMDDCISVLHDKYPEISNVEEIDIHRITLYHLDINHFLRKSIFSFTVNDLKRINSIEKTVFELFDWDFYDIAVNVYESTHNYIVYKMRLRDILQYCRTGIISYDGLCKILNDPKFITKSEFAGIKNGKYKIYDFLRVKRLEWSNDLYSVFLQKHIDDSESEFFTDSNTYKFDKIKIYVSSKHIKRKWDR